MAVESFIDLSLNGRTHRVTLRHDLSPTDAVLELDGIKINPRVRSLPHGAALLFDIDEAKVAVLLRQENEKWEYDCFVDGESVINSMPWRFGQLDVPAVLRWKEQSKRGKLSFFLFEAAKGMLVGVAIFLVLYACAFVFKSLSVEWWHLLLSVVPLVLLYLLFAPREWAAGEAAVEQYDSWKNPGADASEPDKK